VALHELESMQEDLIKLFSERFDELGKKVEDLRTRLEIKAEKEEEAVTPTIELPSAEASETPERETEKEKKKVRKKPAPAPTPKTDAEKRIEEIRAEVEKVLERLGQIEVEGES
jgi:outer membrane biosynthesis protein TonB